MNFEKQFEEIKVKANELVEEVRRLLQEGNVRRVIIKDTSGNTFMEVPLNIAAIGVIAVPVLAAIGALAALAADFTIVVERAVKAGAAAPEAAPTEAQAEPAPTAP
ncbi:MAG TPA: hypothetical protein DEH78_23765 [Solibacterales bacterium]|nr:hypothetical protein [Bryobacterales bacterium]